MIRVPSAKVVPEYDPEIADRVVAIARSQLGVVELTGKNDGVPAERYMRGDKMPWCAGFVLWCYDQAGCPLAGNWWQNRAVAYLHQGLSLAGHTFDACEFIVMPGDLVFFRSTHTASGPSGHVGIVEDILHSADGRDTHYKTIEGNSANMVRRARYLADDPRIADFARWTKRNVKGVSINGIHQS